MRVARTNLVGAPTGFLCFPGKGGVDRTSRACATAVKLADSGQRVPLVRTDPASTLDGALGTQLANVPTPIPGAAQSRRLFDLPQHFRTPV